MDEYIKQTEDIRKCDRHDCEEDNDTTEVEIIDDCVDEMQMLYVISSSNKVHIIRDNLDNGWCGIWKTVCGKELHPIEVMDSIPEGAKMCSICSKYREDNH